MSERRYVTVDVFTDQAFGGNPLAVVLDAQGLDSAAMQSIAKEFNYSETTFVLPPADPAHTAHIRIFTPAEELPFAGHPTVGTAVVLAAKGRTSGREIVLEEGVGPVRVVLGEGRATFFRDGAPEERECDASIAEVADALGVPAEAIVGAPWQASYGTCVLMVPLADRETVAASALRRDRFEALGLAARGAYVFAVTSEGGGEAALHARFFAPALGVGEDPATGSAAASLAGSIKGLRDNDSAGNERLRMRITQGVEMGRPSLIETETIYRDGAVSGIAIGGAAVIVGEGRLLHLP
jgi:trans-2,3-dihydro-3-hydroxyanthranilate isomerase